MMGDLIAPRRPVVDDVVTPEVELDAEALLAEQPGEVLRALERPRRVLPGALAADQQPLVVPGPGVEAVDAVHLEAAGLDQPAERVDHPALLVLAGISLLRGEGEERPAVVAVSEEAAGAEGDPAAVHPRTCATSSRRWGSSASRQAVQLWASRTSCNGTFSLDASARLQARFCSPVPHVSVVGLGSHGKAPLCTAPTKRVRR